MYDLLFSFNAFTDLNLRHNLFLRTTIILIIILQIKIISYFIFVLFFILLEYAIKIVYNFHILLRKGENIMRTGLPLLFAIIGGFALLLLVIAIGLYVLLAIGLYTLAKNENIEYPWFAFIPILQLYIIGKILKEIKIGNFTIPNLEIVLPVIPIAIGFLNLIPILRSILSLAYFIFNIIVTYQFFKRYKGDQAVVFTVLSAISFFLLYPIFVFTIRNATPLTTEKEIAS